MKGKSVFFGVFLAVCIVLFSGSGSSNPEHYDILIKNTTIVDGTGQAAFMGDVAINGKKIAAVGNVKGEADLEIDGSGLVTSPGFIDSHTHADNNILRFPEAGNFIMQGITTVVTGNCGGSPAPRQGFTFADWLAKVEETKISPNMAQLVGHVGIRTAVMGKDFKREATPEEVDQMKAYVEEAMQNGAFGMSTMIDPPTAGEYASVENELIPLNKIVAKYGGGFWPHKRHHRSHWGTDDPEELGYGIFHGPEEDAFVGTYRGLEEVIHISKEAGLPLHVGHLVNAYRIPQPHPDFLEAATAQATLWIIDKAIEEGQAITFDVTFAPMGVARRNYLIKDFWRSRNIHLSWLNELGREEAAEQLKTEEVRDKIRDIHRRGKLKLGMIHTKADPYWMDRFTILNCVNEEYMGKTVSEIAKMKDMEALDILFMLLEEDPETVWVQHQDERYFEASIPVLLKHPNASPNTDWACAPPITDPKGVLEGENMWYASSPIAYGLFADYIGTLVRDKKEMTLEEAVNRATLVPAKKALGLDDRGILAAGAYADIVVFNLETIRMTGDWIKPAQPPDGIEWVIVNGEVVYKDKTHTGAKPGMVLRHKKLLP